MTQHPGDGRRSGPHSTFLLMSIVLPIVIAFIGMSFSYRLPLFSITVLLVSVAIVTVPNRLRFILRSEFVILFFIPALFTIVAILLEPSAKIDIVSLLLNAVTTIILALMLSSLGSLGEADFERFLLIFEKALYSLGVVIALLGIAKFIIIANGGSFPLVQPDINGRFPAGSSLVTDYNAFSLVLVFCFLIGTREFSLHKGFFTRALLFCTLAFISACVFLSGSRRGFIYIVISVLLLPFMKNRNNQNRLTKAISIRKIAANVALVLMILTGGLVFIEKTDSERSVASLLSTLTKTEARLETILNASDTREGSFRSRLVRWDWSAKEFERRPFLSNVFGGGFSYLSDLGKYFDTETRLDYPHNMFLSVLLSNGAIGLLGLIAVIVVAFILVKEFAKNYKRRQYLLFFFIYLSFIMSSGDQYLDHRGFTILIAITLGARITLMDESMSYTSGFSGKAVK